jgi:hypothetical protein
MLFKIIMALVTGWASFAVVTVAKKWDTDGLLPGWLNEGSGEPVSRDGPGFRMTIIWYKFIAVVLGLFCLLSTGSLIVDIVQWF